MNEDQKSDHQAVVGQGDQPVNGTFDFIVNFEKNGVGKCAVVDFKTDPPTPLCGKIIKEQGGKPR